NLEPEGFSKLNSRQGKLHNLMNNQKRHIQKLTAKIHEQVRESEARIKEIKDHYIEDEKELRMIYVHQVLTKLPSNSILEQSINTLLDDEGFQNVIDAELTYSRFQHYHSNMYTPSVSIE